LNLRELAPGDETDVLFFVGCAAAFDDRNKKVARSFVSLMNKAGVDYGVLGFDETCCGETARRMGNEYLFQVFAEQNLEAMGKSNSTASSPNAPTASTPLKMSTPIRKQLQGHTTQSSCRSYLYLITSHPMVMG
jgi:hypothetical protein